MKKFVAIVSFISVCRFTSAQEVDQVVATLITQDNTAYYQFTYRLTAGQDNIPAFVRLRIKTSNRDFYATKVTGAVGEMVFPGAKTMWWDYGDELVHYNGAIDYSIEAEPMVAVPSTKRGKQLPVTVRKYLSEGGPFTVALYRRNTSLWRLDTPQEQGSNAFSVTVPKRIMKIRKGYQVALERGNDRYFSNAFRIKPRVNRIWYALPLIAAAVPFVLQELEPDPPLPEPPEVEFD